LIHRKNIGHPAFGLFKTEAKLMHLPETLARKITADIGLFWIR
jgi:hypothetical protein